MNALETYLRRATRGVWGKKRTELIAELRGSIEARIWMLECQGYVPERALEVALSELGEPRLIATGLIGVHTMPKIFRSTLALGLFAALSVTLINSSRAQIEALPLQKVVFSSGKPLRLIFKGERFSRYYLSFPSIKQNLEQFGITVDDTPQASLYCCANQKLTVPTLRFSLPDSSQMTILQATQDVFKRVNGKVELQFVAPKVTELTTAYMSLEDFVYQLKERSGLPVKLIGWRNPKLTVGRNTLQIGDEQSPVQPWEIYANFVARTLEPDLPDIANWVSTPERHAVRVDAPAGSVFAVVTNSTNSKLNSLDVARVADDGVLYFSSVHKVLRFVGTALEVARDRPNVNKPGYGSSRLPAKAVLVRVAPEFKLSFVIPNRLRSAALK